MMAAFARKRSRVLIGLVLCLAARTPMGAADPAAATAQLPIAATVDTPRRPPLVWDAQVKEYHAQAGETNAHFVFSVTNTGPSAVLITEVRASCGCVVATLPEYPWRLAAGTNGLVQVIADLRGLLHKMVYVHTAVEEVEEGRRGGR